MKNMKFLLSVLLALLCFSFNGSAQGSAASKAVQWQFSIKKIDNDQYRFEAKAVMDKGFHIFAQDPGGDGTLIPTSFIVEALQNGSWTSDWKESTPPKAEMIQELGETVRYHEKTIVFYRDFKGKRGDKVKGAVQFQSCNDQMCFPPAVENFVVLVN